MKRNVTIKILSDGITQLLHEPGVSSACKNAADGIAAKAGDGFEVDGPWNANFGGGRVAYSVRTATYEARKAEADKKTLTRAVF